MKKIIDKCLPETDLNLYQNISVLCLIVVFSGIFGWIYEFIFYYFNGGMKEFYMQGGNFLPWINIYAFGAVMIYFLTRNYRKKPIAVFLISLISTGVLEYVTGLVIYEFFDGLRLWDYNTEILNFGNIGGFICLRSVLFFGLSGLILIYLIVPFCTYLASKFDSKKFCQICILICFIFLFDEVYNLIIARLLNIPIASDFYKSIGFKYVEFGG